MADCELCGKPQRADTAYVCRACGIDLAGDPNDPRKPGLLNTAAELWPELLTTCAGQARMAEPGPHRRGRAPAQPIRPGIGAHAIPTEHPCHVQDCPQLARWQLTAAWNGQPILLCPDHQHVADRQDGHPGGLPVQMYAVQVRDDVRDVAITWARHIVNERGGYGPADPPALLRWLAGQVEWVRHQPWAAMALEELEPLKRWIENAIDRPRPRVDAGECGSPTDQGPCRQRLSAAPGAAIVHCPTCRATWSATERSAVILAAARWLWLTPDEIAQVLTMRGIYTTSSMVRNLAARDRIVGSWVRDRAEQTDRQVYLVRDVEQLRRAKLGMPRLADLTNEDQRTHTPYTLEVV